MTPLGESVCLFCDKHAVVWLADGRGACGKHHERLARLPVEEVNVE